LTMLTPWRIATRPFASVIQRPEWLRGAVGAAHAAEQAVAMTDVAMTAMATALLAPDTPPA
jgi:hypothetical protein